MTVVQFHDQMIVASLKQFFHDSDGLQIVQFHDQMIVASLKLFEISRFPHCWQNSTIK